MPPLREIAEPKRPLQEERNRLSEEFLAELIHKLIFVHNQKEQNGLGSFDF